MSWNIDIVLIAKVKGVRPDPLTAAELESRIIAMTTATESPRE
jgi:hypothetical protein